MPCRDRLDIGHGRGNDDGIRHHVSIRGKGSAQCGDGAAAGIDRDRPRRCAVRRTIGHGIEIALRRDRNRPGRAHAARQRESRHDRSDRYSERAHNPHWSNP
jgi:hypothetical protein